MKKQKRFKKVTEREDLLIATSIISFIAASLAIIGGIGIFGAIYIEWDIFKFIMGIFIAFVLPIMSLLSYLFMAEKYYVEEE